jgi:hypothetical protein
MSQRLRYVWPAIPALLALVPFAGAFSTSNVFFVRDLGLFFWPRHLWLWQTTRDGEWPFWDPYAGGGQSAVPDALNQLFLLPATLVRVFAPPVAGFNFWVAAPFPFFATGAWLWLRGRFSGPAAAVGACVGAVAGPIVSSGNFPNVSWTVALIPWILVSIDRLCESNTPRRFSALAVLMALQAIAGEPVTFAATCALALAYIILGVPNVSWTERRGSLLWVTAAIATGVLLAAVQLVPLGLAASRSMRGVGIDTTFWSLHPLSLLELVLPHLFGNVYHINRETLPWMMPLNAGREPLFYSLYVGIGACALALVSSRNTTVQRWRSFWWLVIAICTISALGEHTSVYPAAQRFVPLLQAFRYPVKYIVFLAIAMAALAAAGADTLLTHRQTGERMRRPSLAVLVLGVIAVLATVLGSGSLGEMGFVSRLWESAAARVQAANPADAAGWMRRTDALWLRLAALAAFAAFMIVVVWRRHRLSPIAAVVVCAMAVADPLAVNADLHPTLPHSRLGPPEWLDAMQRHRNDRIYVGGRVPLTGGRLEPTELVDYPGIFRAPVEWSPQEALTIYGAQLALFPAAWKMRELISDDLPGLWPREYTTMLHAFRDAAPAERLRFLRRTGHRYCFVPKPFVAGAQPLSAPEMMRPMALYECHDWPSRVYVTEAALVEPDLGRQIELMFNAEHDPFAAVLLAEHAPAADGALGAEAVTPSAAIVRERNTELVVSASAGASGGYLNVMDSYDPYWIVEVDGNRATQLRANGLFRAVRLAPGKHEVRFVYRPLPLYIGSVVSAAAAFILIVACVRQTWTARRGGSQV